MIRTSVKGKLQRRELCIGSWITLGHPSIAEIMVKAGFEWLTIDMEHSAITLSEAQQLIQVIELAGSTPLVRIGENNPNLIKPVMDAGAHGVIVPMVNSREEAKAAVAAVRYPPDGKRGIGLGRAQHYGVEFEQYKAWLKKESIVIVQVEHIQAVEHLDEILSVDGVDGFLVGPYDLSGSLGIPGAFEHAEMKGALKRIQDVALRRGIAAGIHVIPPDPQELLMRVREGFSLIAFSLDALFLDEACRSRLRNISDLLSK